MSNTFEEIKLRLTVPQRLAAETLVSNDFAKKGERMTLGEIATELSIDNKTLYNWRKNPDFTAYQAGLSDNRLDQFRSLADSQLIRLIDGTSSNNGLPSIKGLTLFYEIVGRKKQEPMVQIHNGRTPTMSREEASAELEKFTTH